LGQDAPKLFKKRWPNAEKDVFETAKSAKKYIFNCQKMQTENLCPYLRPDQPSPSTAIRRCHGDSVIVDKATPVTWAIAKHGK
jgi:hypothetical protein